MSSPAKNRKGFTLIELLVVLAVLGVVAAGVVVAINPLKRIRQANDAKIKNDVGQIATALQAYFTTNQVYPVYPDGLTTLVTSGDLKVLPTPPTGSGPSYGYLVSSPCTTVSCEASIWIYLQDISPAGDVWCWRSATGVAGVVSTQVASFCSP